ncbi:MAG: hypothetical protein H8D34_03280 [Chloroflexi bacterium]|nr:hypothetical protein [Chloroflexota bacterium]
MHYKDLIQFDPIEDIIQLCEADEIKTAQNHIETYVISDRMADQLMNVVIPQLQVQTPQNNKGVLIVGNYGTGKSHLMSVVSAIAEYPDLLSSLRHAEVAEAAQQISGKFKVWRVGGGGGGGGPRGIFLGGSGGGRGKERGAGVWPPHNTVAKHQKGLVLTCGNAPQKKP